MKTRKADVHVNKGTTKGITIISNEKWYTRIWVFLSNPFRYLFTGMVRY